MPSPRKWNTIVVLGSLIVAIAMLALTLVKFGGPQGELDRVTALTAFVFFVVAGFFWIQGRALERR